MTDTTLEQVPDGFVPMPRGLGFSDNLQPSYRRIEGDSVSFGLVVQQQHGNLMGICHGGVLMTLADIAAANGVNVARGVHAGSPTINLAVDFISAARPGAVDTGRCAPGERQTPLRVLQRGEQQP